MKHLICNVADIPATGSIVMPFFGREVHVYRAGDRVRVAANTCLHFGGPLECKEANYDMATGLKTEGPAPANARLMFLSTRVEEGGLYYVWGD